MRDYPSFPKVIPLLKEDSYVLLTRPPLKLLLLKVSVRLACVKHTASVHPEPGSNSQKIQIIHEEISSFSELDYNSNLNYRTRSILSASNNNLFYSSEAFKLITGPE